MCMCAAVQTISFAQEGVPCETGDMPFMVVETHNSRDVARLRVNEDDVRERLLEVRDELKVSQLGLRDLVYTVLCYVKQLQLKSLSLSLAEFKCLSM
jgi:hypothetical protein